ncbi:hypothetical protein ACR9E3_26575 [Actinomycetospora sp. C-140]
MTSDDSVPHVASQRATLPRGLSVLLALAAMVIVATGVALTAC